MKALIKRAFSAIGLGVYRLDNGSFDGSKKPVVASPIHHNSKAGLEEFYSDAETVESYLDPAFYDRLIDLLASHGVDYQQKHVADIGCGTGGLLKALKNRFQPRSLTGFEYSEKALDLARAKVPGVEFCYFDIYEGSPRQFDVIFCVEVLEHLLHPDKALRNVLAMLDNSGIALVTVPNGRIDTFEGHINFWSPESWEVFLKQMCREHKIETGLTENTQNNYAVITR
ncbi:MAG TPA: class I SAM-dependent methyltransferase [Pyrinomonadaceae bacterium]|nr:class I SAM-dependent methyltransferase [Pyrinomonadaceae bacterium]